jgi:HK97 family phage portal protein
MAWNMSNKAIGRDGEKAISIGAPVAYNAGMAGKPYTDGWDIERAYREGVQKVTWVYRAIDAISSNQARLPITFLEDNSPYGEQVERSKINTELSNLLNQRSNDGESSFAFRYRVSSQLLMSTRGVFIEIVRGRGGSPVALHLLPPQSTAPIPDPKKFVSAFEVDLPGGKKQRLNPKNVIWIRRPHPLDPYLSMTPMESAGVAIETDQLAKLYNRNFLLNDGRPGGLLVLRGQIDEDDKAELAARFRGNLARTGGIGVISSDDGADFVDTAASPRDAAWDTLRQITKEEILASFGVPESVIGNASGRTFANAAEEGRVFWSETMDPHLELLSRGLDILDDNYYVTFDTSSVPVLEMGKQERDRYYLTEVQQGLITPNEYRVKTGKQKVDAYLADSMLASPNLAPIGNTEEPMPKEEVMPAPPAAPGMEAPLPPEGALPEGVPEVPEANPVQEPELADGAFPKGDSPEGIEVKRFDLEDTWETKAAQDVDRWEAIFGRALERYFQRQERVIIEKVSGAKAKRLLSGGELKVENIFDTDIWNKQIEEDLAPVIEGAMLEAASTALKASDEKIETSEEEIQEYVASQVKRAQSVNATTRKELAAAILLSGLLVGDNETAAPISAKMAMLSTSVAAVFAVLLTKRLITTAEVESNAAYNAGLFFGGKRAGATNKTWITRKDVKVRTGHAVIENKTVDIKESFKTGVTLRFPGDPLAPPELVINCRCLIRFGE